MKYSPEALRSAYAELDNRREKALAVHNSHVATIEAYPEIYCVYTNILSTKTKLANVIFSKKDDIKAEIERIKDENLEMQSKLKALLISFGYSPDYLDVKYTCPKCSDTGTSNGNRCECVTALLDKYSVYELNKQCKIKLHTFAEFNLDYYPESVTYKGNVINAKEKMMQNLKFCIDYTNNFSLDSPGLLLLGETGLGKTFLSSCIACEVLKKGYSVAFDSIQNYLRDIEKEHFGRSQGDTLETLLNADLVILDDLGSEFSSSFNSASIYNIINSRANMGKPTVVSTNLSLEDLQARYDDRIISRLLGMYLTLRFIGSDIRLIKRKNGEVM
ncbi:MAG: ATP-binding protein [Oscillospiraceae bacterium]|nr:ATP-binding protein [Oscillospiraceae bacterium]